MPQSHRQPGLGFRAPLSLAYQAFPCSKSAPLPCLGCWHLSHTCCSFLSQIHHALVYFLSPADSFLGPSHCSTQSLLIEEVGAEAKGASTATAPSLSEVSDPFENLVKATDFGPSQLHINIPPQDFYTIIGVG